MQCGVSGSTEGELWRGGLDFVGCLPLRTPSEWVRKHGPCSLLPSTRKAPPLSLLESQSWRVISCLHPTPGPSSTQELLQPAWHCPHLRACTFSGSGWTAIPMLPPILVLGLEPSNPGGPWLAYRGTEMGISLPGFCIPRLPAASSVYVSRLSIFSVCFRVNKVGKRY